MAAVAVTRSLQSVNVHGLSVERDLYFKQGTFGEVIACFRKERGE
jgi:hypothetical protein